MTPDEEHGRAPSPSHAAFDACFEAHYSDLLAFAVRRVDARTTAEDVLSETFAVAWRRRDAIPEPALPWLYGIARRIIANEHRSLRRRARLRRKLAAEPPRTGRDPADLAGEREAVLVALSRLTEAQREILRLTAWEGLDAQDAAAVLDCTPSTFRVRLHRARRELAKQLEAAGHIPDEHGVAARPQDRGANGMTDRQRADEILELLRDANPASASEIQATTTAAARQSARERSIRLAEGSGSDAPRRRRRRHPRKSWTAAGARQTKFTFCPKPRPGLATR